MGQMLQRDSKFGEGVWLKEKSTRRVSVSSREREIQERFQTADDKGHLPDHGKGANITIKVCMPLRAFWGYMEQLLKQKAS
ncbi:hypothetical protein CHS0354_034233 [Potamilus streckersoni]|uniref:Uncharacterized protein n=1 Tax=Potamilus streckersoni TaxID=2493646 RepID=A0AAE0SU20_9BIVA|nr:hypothetical protein CHS0354_034233 [Potamilus streckersoni]